MNCVDAIEELGVSTGPPAPALAEHLAACPRCAAWARRDVQVAELWAATRPEEPSAEAWGAVWGNVTAALAAPALTVLPAPALKRPWQRWVPATLGIAQAAALLGAAIWLGTQTGPARAAVARVEIPASDGALVLIENDGADLRIVSLGGPDASAAAAVLEFAAQPVDPSFVMLGKLEAMAD
jgi:hypothetical protein